MSNYEKKTIFTELGTVYIKDGKKFATIRLGNQSFIANLEDANKKFERLVGSGHMTQDEANEKIANNNAKGAKYSIVMVVEQ